MEKNKEKAAKKREKRSVKAEKINAMAQTNTRSIKDSASRNVSGMSEKERERRIEQAKSRAENAKEGSLAAKANMVKKFNENKSLESLRISRINSARQKIIFKTVSFPLAIELKPSPKRVSMSAGSNWLMISLSKQSTFTAPCNSIFITESV